MGLLFVCAFAQTNNGAMPVIGDDDIPDSSTRARWRIQKTVPVLVADLDSSAIDLKRPDNIRQTVEYDDSANVYYIGSKIGDTCKQRGERRGRFGPDDAGIRTGTEPEGSVTDLAGAA